MNNQQQQQHHQQQQQSSILKKRKRSRTESSSSSNKKLSVSFDANTRPSSTATSSTISAATLTLSNNNNNNNNNGHQHPVSKRRSEYRDMSMDEEDALDPLAAASHATNDTEAIIRKVKAERAVKRHDALLSMDDHDDHNFHGGGEEEEVDGRYSLLSEQKSAAAVANSNNNSNNHHDVNATSTFSNNDNDNNNNALTMEEENGTCPIEPFNLRSEREDGMGYFDGDTYVFRRNQGKDDGEEEDAWLDDLNNNNNNDKNNQKSNNNDEQSSFSAATTASKTSPSSGIMNQNEGTAKEMAYEQLIPFLANDQETILQALGRYGNIVKREKKQQQKQQRKNKINHTTTTTTTNTTTAANTNNTTTSTAPSASVKVLNKITELCNLCMMKFDNGANIYDQTKLMMQEFLQKSDYEQSLKRKNISSSIFDEFNVKNEDESKQQQTTNQQEQVQWEYKGNSDNLMHGPYSTQQMMQWIHAGYFVGKMAVDVRIVSKASISTENEKSITVNDLLDDLNDSDDNDDNDTSNVANNVSEKEWQRSDQVKFESYL